MQNDDFVRAGTESPEVTLIKEFIPPELKSVLERQEVEFDLKFEKAENEIRRLSQVNEDLMYQIEERTVEIAIMEDKTDTEELDELKREREELKKKVESLAESQRDAYAPEVLDRVRIDLNQQLRIFAQIVEEKDEELEDHVTRVNQLKAKNDELELEIKVKIIFL